MDLLKIASQLFMNKLGATGQGLDAGAVQSALGALLGGDDGKLDLSDLLGKLNGGGLAGLAQSWLGDGANASITPSQILDMFGQGRIGAFASSLNLDTGTASNGLAEMLPELVDKHSSGGNLLEAAGGGAGLLGAASKLFR